MVALIRECIPDFGEYEITTMSRDNWIRQKFRTGQLYRLINATPEQRESAARAAAVPRPRIVQGGTGPTQ